MTLELGSVVGTLDSDASQWSFEVRNAGRLEVRFTAARRDYTLLQATQVLRELMDKVSAPQRWQGRLPL